LTAFHDTPLNDETNAARSRRNFRVGNNET
jgi:hypothetical protein